MSITGVAGLFIGCPDPAPGRDWCSRHPGIRFSDEEAARYFWRETDTAGRAGPCSTSLPS